MLKIKCKICNNENNIKKKFIIEDKTVCPDCKNFITLNGDKIDIEEFIDLPLKQRNQLKEVEKFRTNRGSQFLAIEKFHEEIKKYTQQFFQYFPDINLNSLGIEITGYLIDNNKEMSDSEIIAFKRVISMINAMIEMQEMIVESEDMNLSEIIEKCHGKIISD